MQNNSVFRSKRLGTENWRYCEQNYLLTLIRQEWNIIENRNLRDGTRKLKSKAWKRIQKRFSANFDSKSCFCLKDKWRRMKELTIRKISDYNNEAEHIKKPSAFIFDIWDLMQTPSESNENESDVKSHHDLFGVLITEKDQNDNNNDGSIDWMSTSSDINYMPARLESICISHMIKFGYIHSLNNTTNNNNNNNNNGNNNQQNGSVIDQQLPPGKRQRRTSLIQHEESIPTTTSSSMPSSSSPSEMHEKEHLLRIQILEAKLQKYKNIIEILLK